MEKTRIVFDVDDTICSNVRRLGYEHCIPDYEVIKKINHLHDDLGFAVVLHTARGMVSCNGDIDKIIAKNKKVLEEWLKKHDVHYDELIFGKPLGDLYVDDKALDVVDFKSENFGVLHGGGSGQPIYHLGRIVKKFFNTEKETTNFKDWVEDNNGVCKFPRIISYLYNSVYMEYINGDNLVDCFSFSDFLKVVLTIVKFSEMKRQSFDVSPLIEGVENNYSNDEEMNSIIDLCKNLIMKYGCELSKHASYSHGDMILSNIMRAKDGVLYYIDSRYSRNSSSYLFDFAKLRMSICGYERDFGLSKADNSGFLSYLDSTLKVRGIYEVTIILQLMFIIRLYRYKSENDKAIVKRIAKELIRNHEELLKWD